MELNEFELKFLKQIKPKIMALDLPIYSIFKAAFHPDYKGSEEDRQKYENYTRMIIFNQTLIPAAKIFFLTHSVFPYSKDLDQKFIDFYKQYAEIIGL